MVQVTKSSTLAYWLTIIMAMAMTIISWPGSFAIAAPDWVLLTLLYWGLATPETASVGKAWLVGLLVDVLTGQLLGEYALAYAVAVYLSVKQHKRIRHYPVMQQSLIVFAILLLARILVFWIENIDHQVMPLSFWLPVFTGSLVWPLVFIVLRKIRLF